MADGCDKEGEFQKPLLIFFDSEAANGSVYYGDIIEIAAKCHPEILDGSFQTFINTKQDLCSFVLDECGITREHLSGKPFFPKALRSFLKWIDGMVASASHKNGPQYFPVLCAHGGYCFDFLILLGNMERSGLYHHLLDKHNLYFADSFEFCKEIQEQGEPLLQHPRLSLNSLFLEFFPGEVYKDRHRAMGDVDAMLKIFTESPLKNQIHKLTYTTAKERVTYYINQASLKLQQQILEDNLSRLDACTKNMMVKQLIREGLTYDRLQRIFEDCCSFMDFFQFLKDKGVERKVAKSFALQFGGMGLQNQGALSNGTESTVEKHKPVTTTRLGSSAIATNGCSTTPKVPLNPSKKNVTFKEPVEDRLPTRRLENPPTAPSGKEHDGNEDWEEEIVDFGQETPEFTLTFDKAIPISLIIEDVCSSVSRTEQAISSRGITDRKKARLADCQSNSKHVSSSKAYRKGRVLEKKRKSEARSTGIHGECSGLSSAESKSSSMGTSEIKVDEAPPERKDVNETLDQVARFTPDDGKVLNRKTEAEMPQQCVWFTDEPRSGLMASSVEIQEFVTVFIGDVAIRVPVNADTRSKTPCDTASQKQSPCLDHEQELEDQDCSTRGERSVKVNGLDDFKTETNLVSDLNQGEIPVQTTSNALETEAVNDPSSVESFSELPSNLTLRPEVELERGLSERTESEQACNGVCQRQLSETAAIIDSTETSNIISQFAHPEALGETTSTRTSPECYDAEHLSENQTWDSKDSNPCSVETFGEAFRGETGFFPVSKEQRPVPERGETRGLSSLENEVDKEVEEELVSSDNPTEDFRHGDRIHRGQHVAHEDPAVVQYSCGRSYQDTAEGNGSNAEEELRHCGRIVHHLYSSNGNHYMENSAHGNPYGENSARGNPYGENSARGNPYRENSARGNPYRENSARGNPYRVNSARGNPYRENLARENPYRGNSARENPYRGNLSHGNPYRGIYHYPSTSQPPVSFVPRMMPMQPMFMQHVPCLYPQAYGPADFRGHQSSVPLFAPPAVQQAMFQASSGLYPHSEGMHSGPAAPAEQESATLEDCAVMEFEPNEESPGDGTAHAAAVAEHCATTHYDHVHSGMVTRVYAASTHDSQLSHSGLTETWDRVAPQIMRNGISNDPDGSSCSSFSTDREEETPNPYLEPTPCTVEAVCGPDQSGTSVNGISTTWCDGSVRSENESTRDTFSSSSCFSSTTLERNAGATSSSPPTVMPLHRSDQENNLSDVKALDEVNGDAASFGSYLVEHLEDSKGATVLSKTSTTDRTTSAKTRSLDLVDVRASVGSAKPRQIKRQRNCKALQNGTDGRTIVSRNSKGNVALPSPHNGAGYGKEPDRTNCKVSVAPKRCCSRNNREESKSFNGDCCQSEISTNALETTRRSRDEIVIAQRKRDVKMEKGATTTVSNDTPGQEDYVVQKKPLPPKNCATFQENSKKSRIHKRQKRGPRQDLSENSKPKSNS